MYVCMYGSKYVYASISKKRGLGIRGVCVDSSIVEEGAHGIRFLYKIEGQFIPIRHC